MIVSGLVHTSGGAATTVGATARRELTPQGVADLTVTDDHPCISVLMPTTRALRMPMADRERLDGLVRDVERRLADDDVPDRDRLVRELRRLARVAQDSSTWNALGLFVSRSVSQSWTLPVTVHPKVVVESTFATRDLLRALHRTPPHLVVRVDAFGARVFWVAARATLIETVERLPGSPHGPDSASEDRRDLLSRIDACVARIRAERPAPLVLAGDPGLVAELRSRVPWLHRLAGEVVDSRADAPDELFAATALCVEDYLNRRGQQTLHALHEAAATTPEQVVAGLDECWDAVVGRTPGTLVVEHGYVHPRPPGEDRGAPASHDLIDDLLELALEAGNLIAFVDDAQLHEFGGIAMLRAP